MFWHQFKVQDFHNLVPTKKWRVEKRNMRKGDIVLIMYTGKAKSAEYKLGRVVVAECISVAEQKSKKEYVDRLERMLKKKEM